MSILKYVLKIQVLLNKKPLLVAHFRKPKKDTSIVNLRPNLKRRKVERKTRHSLFCINVESHAFAIKL